MATAQAFRGFRFPAEVIDEIGVRLARGKQGQLPRHHGLDRPAHQLVGDPRKGEDRLAELEAFLSMAERGLERAAV